MRATFPLYLLVSLSRKEAQINKAAYRIDPGIVLIFDNC
jgi:hypothetical protein